ncbi:hypothetical protein ACFOMD_01990 [Sphingoaurantiacus capsulatus]|uniref:Uncharacterized protein n=1 Tax=Sphingoaurantiacus capsulatus TaxID=1771310 RepID=A0ABV7X7T6_9SPHN
MSLPAAHLPLDPLHIEALRLAVGAAHILGMPDADTAARADHPLWTAALLIHEVATSPAWKAGAPRPAGAVEVALNAARRLTDAAFVALAAHPERERQAA